MNKTLVIFGRQPALGLAEIESLYGADTVTPIGNHGAIIDIDPNQFDINRVGGTVKAAKLLTQLEFTDWQKLSDYLVEHVPKHTCCIGPGKLLFGISTYGLQTNQKAIERTALSVKKAVRQSDMRPVRVIPTKGTELSSAQVLHNKLAQPPLGMELLLVQHGDSVYLAQTVGVQDIEAYAARDQARPKRDARVGMLPPKLAQIILNLAIGDLDAHIGEVILDPFCGTGVILQEAQIMKGFDVYGTDIDPRMVEYSKANLEWLHQTHQIATNYFRLEVGDATSYQWDIMNAVFCIACETYLGRPFAHTPDPETLHLVMNDVNTIHKKFLQNVAKQTSKGFRMCIAVPAWFINGSFKHLSTLDHLEELGYNRLSFKHVDNKSLIYHREGQIVGRELVVLVRK